MADSETLRAALREAETAIIDAVKKTDHDAPGDKQPLEEPQTAAGILTKLRQALERGTWLGRKVDSYPAPGE